MARVRAWLLAGLAGVLSAGCSAASADQAATTTATAAVSRLPGAVVTTPTVSTTIPPASAAAPPTSATVVATSATVPAPCDVVAVGDSVGVDLIDNGLGDSLAAVGCELKWAGGRRGITVTEGASELSGANDITADVAVVILGYHNARSETQAGRFPSLIDTVMKAAGSRLVVWPMLAATDDCSDSYKTAAGVASANLRDAMARWPNLVVVDYPSVLAAHPEYSEQRCPHLLADGSKAVAAWLAGEVRAAVNAAAG